MDREILFRGKRTDNGEWIEGNLITGVFLRGGRDIPYIMCPDKADYDCFEDFSVENGISEVDPETVCQYTGLTDKNGRKIFEGDIVEIPSDDAEIYIIEWDIDTARFTIVQHGSVICDFDNYWGYELEIIGNIFDNAELLEGGVQ